MVTPRRPEVTIRDKNKKVLRVTECTIEQMLISKNPYITLKVDDIIRNDVETNTVPETKISEFDSNKTEKKHNIVRYCTSTEEPVEQKKKSETQHNLQNQNKVN